MKEREMVGKLAAVLILVAFCCGMISFVFTYFDSQATVIANFIAPGSLGTADYYIFSQIQTFSLAIVAICILLLVVEQAQRGRT